MYARALPLVALSVVSCGAAEAPPIVTVTVAAAPGPAPAGTTLARADRADASTPEADEPVCAVFERDAPPTPSAARPGPQAPLGHRVPSLRRPTMTCCYTSPSTVRAWLAPVRAGAKRCYERALARRPSLQGRLAVRFDLGDDGRTTRACDAGAGTDIDDPELVRCVLQAFADVQGAADDGCGVRRILYPLQFGT
jgi:hypothetical protein